MPLELDLTGRRALVTGAGQGVGRGIALGLAAAGAAVVVNDLVEARAEEVVDQIVAAGGSAVAAAFDVTDHAAVAAAVTAAASPAGPLEILVNNAGNAGVDGFGARGPFVESDPAQWEPYLRVNLYGAMHCTHAALPGMIDAGWGRVITIVSDSGRTGDKHMAAYSAAKAGAAGFMRAIALEGGQHGITANCVALGTMRTAATEQFWQGLDSGGPDSPAAKALLQRYVIRRPGSPDDVSPLVVFLASDAADWITGQTYPVNGGFSFGL
jgi:NAD(P)-dependent dehydrogenase (short-subunit alcohol dehydrogenase family)